MEGRESHRMKIAGLVLLGLLLLCAGLLFVGTSRWRAQTATIRSGLVPSTPAVPRVDFGVLRELPTPVRRYLQLTLADGGPTIRRARIQHSGRFDMGQKAPRWRPFTSDQVVVVRPLGFDWNGRVDMVAGLPARVHDAYVGGRGLLIASVAGLIPVARLGGEGTPAQIQRALDEGELLRFLAEAVWFPTALLPRDGLEWREVDERSAIAVLHDGGSRVELLFGFGADGFVESVRSEGRGRYVDGEMVPTPWQGRFWNVQERAGMHIPIDGEVAWILPEGARPYWRGTIEQIEFELVD